jgi:ferredoxin-NADP reductase
MIALTREDVVGGRAAARIAATDLEAFIVPDATYFVCGSAPFAETASMLLLDLGVTAERIRVERFGPSG